MKTTWMPRCGVTMAMLLLSATLAQAQGTQLLVSNVQAQQRPFTAIWDVTYDLESVGDIAATVSLSMSTNGGTTYPNHCAAVTGDVGDGVLPGTGKHIVWNASTDFPGLSSTTCRLRVTADDKQADFVPIPPGTFMMGSPTTEQPRGDNETQHQVTLTHGLYVQTTEVTNQQYRDMAQWAYDHGYATATGDSINDNLDGSNQFLSQVGDEITFSAGVFSCRNPTRPTKDVTWYGAAAYCDWLNLQLGLPRAYDHSTWQCNAGSPYTAVGYRLPTEAEWEYACRAGTQTPFNTGPCLTAGIDANYNGGAPYTGCPSGPYVGRTIPVGSYPANAFNLYDMHGNLWEWCNDWFGPYGGAETNPVGPGTAVDENRVIRGGNCNNEAMPCRSAFRGGTFPSHVYGGVGFRPVRSSDSIELHTSRYVSPQGDNGNPGTVALPFRTIQHAVDVAIAGDSIVLLDGTYSGDGNRDIDLNGKILTVASDSDDPLRCIIDCGSSALETHQGFASSYAASLDSCRIRGVTITGAQCAIKYVGPGPQFQYAQSMTIENCIIRDNTSGISLEYCKLFMRDCVVVNNTGTGLAARSSWEVTRCDFSSNGKGAKVDISYPLQGTRARFSQCHFNGNLSAGADTWTDYGTQEFLDCELIGNGSDGLIAKGSDYGTVAISGCRLDGNARYGLFAVTDVIRIESSASVFSNNGADGVIYGDLFGRGLALTDCDVFGNGGAGIRVAANSNLDLSSDFINRSPNRVITVSIVNSSIHHNLADGFAAFSNVSARPTSLTFDGATIANNHGSGIDAHDCTMLLSNSVIAFNTLASIANNGAIIGVVACTDVIGNGTGDWNGPLAGRLGANGNLNVDPLFCDAVTGDYHLHQNSQLAAANSGGCGTIGRFDQNCPAQYGFVSIPAGSFTMGSPTDEPGRSWEETQHQVTLTHGIYVQTTEVTNQQYREMAQWAYDHGYVTATSDALFDNLDGSTQGLKLLVVWASDITFSDGVFSCINPTHPVMNVSWYGSAAYCDWLSLQQGLPRAYNHSTWQCNESNPYAATGYRLPTEAEWEYTCRAGTQTPFNTGFCLEAGTEANYWGTYPYAGCPSGPTVGGTVPVGSYPANAFGLYDMHGNLWEWCNDWWDTYGGTVNDPVGAEVGATRVFRGGSWDYAAVRCRSASRRWDDPSGMAEFLGFRVVRSLAP